MIMMLMVRVTSDGTNDPGDTDRSGIGNTTSSDSSNWWH